MSDPTPDTTREVEVFGQLIDGVRAEINKVIVGQQELIDLTLQSLFCHNHSLLEGVPGLAKTLLVTTIAKVLDLTSARIQFTPDLMPSDVTGSEVIQENLETGKKDLEFLPGPIFANLVLADEINRPPPRTQSALLEAMQERQVTVGNHRHVLQEPFFVLATQNPIEQEGTYRLPEAQLDRFMFLITVDYPEPADEIEVMRRTTTRNTVKPETVMSRELVLQYQDTVLDILIREDLYAYILAIVHATRVSKDYCCDYARQWVSWGAGPRACQNLILGAKARALFEGRGHVISDDVKAMAKPVLRHRVLLNYAALAEGITTDHVVDQILAEVPTPAGKS